MAKKPTNRQIHRAVTAAGGIREFAAMLKVSYQAVYGWLYQGARIPAERVLGIEKATRGRVKRHELRPDIYPPPKRARSAAKPPADAMPIVGASAEPEAPEAV